MANIVSNQGTQIKSELVTTIWSREWLKLKQFFKKFAATNIGEDTEQPDLSFIAGRSIKWYNHYGKLVLSSS